MSSATYPTIKISDDWSIFEICVKLILREQKSWRYRRDQIYLQENNKIEKGFDRLIILVSNSKNIKDHFLSQDKSYDWGRLAFMLDTSAGPKNIFRRVKRNHIADIHYQYHGYFGLLGIKKFGYDALPDRLIVSNLQNVNGNIQQVQNFYDRVRSYMISKETELLNKTTFHKKLILHRREYK